VLTFQLTIVLQATLIAAHFLYTQLPALRAPGETISRRVFHPLGLFRMPSQAELWGLGIVGLVSLTISRILLAGEIEYGDVGGKLIDSFVFYQVAPGLIPFRGMFAGRKVVNHPLTGVGLAVYFGLVVVAAAALNSRGSFAQIVFSFGLALILMIALQRIRIGRKAITRGFLAILIGLPLASMAQDLSSAMLAVRNERAQLSTSQLLARTFEAFNDKENLARLNQGQAQLSGTFYSEYYITNSFFQRLTYTKYTDVQVNAASRFGETEHAAVREEFWLQLQSSLPTPLLRLFGSSLDKADLYHSGGDFYDHLAYGTGYGGFKTGSSIVDSKAILGVFWVPGMLLVFLLVFNVIDSFALRQNGFVILSPIVFIQLYVIFTHATVGDSLRVIIDQCGRGFVQSVVIYIVLITVIRAGLTIIGLNQKSPHRPSTRMQ
jgi:hypothetical protein